MNATVLKPLLSTTRDAALRCQGFDRIGIGHALVHNCSFEEAADAIIRHAKASREPAFVATANAQHIVLLNQDRRLREAYNQADLIVADGAALLWAARLYGRPFKERVAGVDLFQRLCGQAAKNNLHVFFLGGRPNSADAAAAVLKGRFPTLQVTTSCPPLGFEADGEAFAKTLDEIRSAKPDILFVALGAPKQEYWIYEHGIHLPVSVLIGVGGSFEMVSGAVRRAPVWMQSAGFEWLHRFLHEPRRLWRRYLIGNFQFAAIVLLQTLRRALLSVFLTLVASDRFAAELHEPFRKSQLRKLVVDVLYFQESDAGKLPSGSYSARKTRSATVGKDQAQIVSAT
jgi:N-acetylglucosaminyldiphosphoundecaprenol N-acetyl-beta-D-mannosaminyltransferase